MILALALATPPAFAVAPTSAAPMASAPIACIYDTYRDKDWVPLVKLVRSGMNATTPAERIMAENIRTAAGICAKRYGWGKKKQDLALRYFVGRVLSTDSTFNLKKYGLDYPKLKQLVAALDAPTQQAYVAGNVTSEQSAATFAALSTVGVDFNTVPAEEKQGFAQKLSQGILGQLVEQDAETAFAAS
jgi:hypothetical protein